jgi:hypothetical protein
MITSIPNFDRTFLLNGLPALFIFSYDLAAHFRSVLNQNLYFLFFDN